MDLQGTFERVQFDEADAQEFAAYLARPIKPDSPTSNSVGGMAIFDELSFEQLYKNFLMWRERQATIDVEPVSEQGRAEAARRAQGSHNFWHRTRTRHPD